jgi:hypothetical protein
MVYGELIGRENMPVNNYTNYINGTGPQWSTFTGSAFEIGVIPTSNLNKFNIQFNKVSGFKNGIEMITGGSRGIQEITCSFQQIFQCANGVNLRSTDGNSFCDKNVFTGINGGVARINAGLGFKIDGNQGAGYTGEFGANRLQNVLFERNDSCLQWMGHVSETLVNMMIEGGGQTGIFGPQVFRLLNVGSNYNYVRGTTFIGCEFFYTNWFANGATLGLLSKIVGTPLFTSVGATYIGSDAVIDGSGNVIYEVPAKLKPECKSFIAVSFENNKSNRSITARSSYYSKLLYSSKWSIHGLL